MIIIESGCWLWSLEKVPRLHVVVQRKLGRKPRNDGDEVLTRSTGPYEFGRFPTPRFGLRWIMEIATTSLSSVKSGQQGIGRMFTH